MDDMLAVHKAVGGSGPGRRYATSQVNNAYAVLVSSQFQKYCRDLHSQAADHIAQQAPATIQAVVLARFTEGRKLDGGNPTPGNLGSDFNRFGFSFWDHVEKLNPRNPKHRKRLEQLNMWRNAIGHHDFSNPHFGTRTSVRLNDVRDWRIACDRLASEFDSVVARHLRHLTGIIPW